MSEADLGYVSVPRKHMQETNEAAPKYDFRKLTAIVRNDRSAAKGKPSKSTLEPVSPWS